MDPNFYKALFMAYLNFEPFLAKISGKFTVKITFRDPNLSYSGGGFTSLGQFYFKKKKLFLYGGALI